jgi:aspartate-semialdehyde dehydrogenase
MYLKDTAREILRAAPGVTISDDRASNRFPTPLEVIGQLIY